MEIPRPTAFLIVLILIVGSIWYLEDRKVGSGGEDAGDTSIRIGESMTVSEKEKMYERAHEISTPDGFINVEEISVMGELEKGNVVLIDFWTYSCINCQRTLPYLRAWHEKYADQGLTIIGVHTPEFEFEKELENVQRAVDQFEVSWPVVLDNDFSTWRSYQNRFWPRKYLIDIDGFIVYDRIGEGGYEQTEMEIVKALEERVERLGLDREVESGAVVGEVGEVDREQPRTPEIYFGHSRLEEIANLPSSDCFDRACDFELITQIPLNGYVLGGTWRIGEEAMTLEEKEGTIGLAFVGNKVNIVAEGVNGPVRAQVFIDTKLAGEFSGADVVDDIVTIDEAGLYNVVDFGGSGEGEHTLELFFLDPGVSAFTFTFG